MKYVNFQLDGKVLENILELKKELYPHMALSAMFIDLALKEHRKIEEDKRK